MARRLAAAISQAPGFSGTPVSGHRSSAVTSASCASSSARRYVARHPCQHGDQPGLFDPPNGEDGAMGVGDRHGRRLSHPPGRRKVRRSRPRRQRHLTHFHTRLPVLLHAPCGDSRTRRRTRASLASNVTRQAHRSRRRRGAHPPGSPPSPAPAAPRSPRCRRRDSAWPIRSPPRATPTWIIQ